MTMPTATGDTIVARASAPGRAGVTVVRISGDDVPDWLPALVAAPLQPRSATLTDFIDADGLPIDRGIAIYFPAPHSYTGEHVLELQGHGGDVVVDMLIRRVCALGARIANAGEFSERAFLNDKMDLAQAEAVADLIDSGSREAARAAMRSLQGEFSAAVHGLTEQVTTLRMHVEAAIDFPEEEIDFLDDAALRQRIEQVRTAFDALQQRVAEGRRLNDGLTVVLAGAPNVGKSSLLNRLTTVESAIVTAVAGTTRDLIREHVVIAGLAVEFIDTAGLRDSADSIEREGIRRTRQALAAADHALVLVAADDPDIERSLAATIAELPAGIGYSIVVNKLDLGEPNARIDVPDAARVLLLSAKTGAGIDALREHIRAVAGLGDAQSGSFSARRRHVEALSTARTAFDAALVRLHDDRAGELMAEELRLCQRALAEITGAFTSDDLLGRIFGEFCIGK